MIGIARRRLLIWGRLRIGIAAAAAVHTWLVVRLLLVTIAIIRHGGTGIKEGRSGATTRDNASAACLLAGKGKRREYMVG